jgi:release factor glutamine methyltransferase
MKTIAEILQRSIDELLKSKIKDARVSAENLLAHVLKCKRMELYLRYDQPLEEKEILDFQALLERRKKREPVGYLCETMPFYHTEIEVGPGVLIPRPETELLVEKAIEVLKKQDLKGKLLVDLCAGSGCIGIAIKKSLSDLRVVLSDISHAALEVAKRNAIRNLAQVEFHQGDLLEGFSSKIDFLFCNPPYVSEEEMFFLDEDVKQYEPALALVAKSHGYEFYERLSKILPRYLNGGAKLFFEIGSTQKEGVKKIFSGGTWSSMQFFCDWRGKDRFFFLENE